MPFLSIEFALFFVLFLPIYWAAYKSVIAQNILLLIISLGWLFYVSPKALLAIVIFSLLVFAIGKGIQQSTTAKKQWLITGLVLIVANLAFFKYVDFFRPVLANNHIYELPDILMPLGLSYYSFQSVAYLVAVYRERKAQEESTQNPQPAALSWHYLLLHLAFLPTITSGPIIRVGRFKSATGIALGANEQIHTTTTRKIQNPAYAMVLMLLGIIKTWWLSGVLSDGYVNPVFENPLAYDFWEVLLAMYGYTVQLFLDFSGYSDLVIGMAMLFGFILPQNFNKPLKAINIRDFWDRWHITLSTWIRDYIYIPLGGSKKGFGRTQLNLLIAMVLSGIWHGYGWNFLLWGSLHGAALILLNIGDRVFDGRELLALSAGGRLLGQLVTLHFVVASFVVFRSESLTQVGELFTVLYQGIGVLAIPSGNVLGVLVLMVLAWIFYEWIDKAIKYSVQFFDWLPYILWWLPISLVLCALVVVAPSGIPAFIYANF